MNCLTQTPTRIMTHLSESDRDTLLKKGEKTNSSRRESKDNLLDTIANDLNADGQTDQDVSEKLAKLVNKRWSEKLTSDKLSEKSKKHSRPGNLGSLVAPRVNPEIWANMSHRAKSVDLRAANTGYLERTKNLRHDHHKLLFSYQKPHRPVSKDTASRWLKTVES